MIGKVALTALVLVIGVSWTIAVGCSGGDDDAASVQGGSIAADEVNRYELEFVGTITMQHTGGLICSVEDGDLVMDFSIDAADGDYEYQAVIADFDPAATAPEAEFTLVYKDDHTSAGTMAATFGYGPAPEDYPRVERAAGEIGGMITGDAGAAEVHGSYACFLTNSEVGN